MWGYLEGDSKYERKKERKKEKKYNNFKPIWMEIELNATLSIHSQTLAANWCQHFYYDYLIYFIWVNVHTYIYTYNTTVYICTYIYSY